MPVSERAMWRRLRGIGAGDLPRAAIAALVLAALALTVAIRAGSGAPSFERLLGQPAPDFALRAEQGGHALTETVSLTALRGHPVLVLFTYTLCPHCLGETQIVQSLASAEQRRGLRVVYMDSPAEAPDIVSAYQQRVGLDAPVLLDTGGDVAKRYGVRYYPTLVLMDARGIVRQVWTGEVSERALERALSVVMSYAAWMGAHPQEHGSGFG